MVNFSCDLRLTADTRISIYAKNTVFSVLLVTRPQGRFIAHPRRKNPLERGFYPPNSTRYEQEIRNSQWHRVDKLTAERWRTQKFVQTDRIAVAGNSFGGIEAVLRAEHGSYCAAIDSASGLKAGRKRRKLQSMMTRSVRNSRPPIFSSNRGRFRPFPEPSPFGRKEGSWQAIRAQDLSILGKSVQDGHTFGYFGSSVWGDDVFRFLNKHCQRGNARLEQDPSSAIRKSGFSKW